VRAAMAELVSECVGSLEVEDRVGHEQPTTRSHDGIEWH
jgi:hypothetical protein